MHLEKQKTSRQISFGQGTPANASVNPSVGQHDTVFFLNASDFDAQVTVQVNVFDSDGYNFYQKDIVTDQNGGIGYAGLKLVTNQGFFPGEYRLVVTGKCRRKNVTVTELFAIS